MRVVKAVEAVAAAEVFTPEAAPATLIPEDAVAEGQAIPVTPTLSAGAVAVPIVVTVTLATAEATVTHTTAEIVVREALAVVARAARVEAKRARTENLKAARLCQHPVVPLSRVSRAPP